MNKAIAFLLSGSLAFAFSACGNKKYDDELEHHHHHGMTEGAEEGAHEEHIAGEIVLEPEMAEMLGVSTVEVEPGDFTDAIAVSGQIINTPLSFSVVSAPTSGIVNFAQGILQGKDIKQGAVVATISSKGMSGGDANQAALVALEAAKKELDRITPLHADGIVSTKDYNAALQAYEQARAAYSQGAASGRAVASTSGVIAQLNVQQGQFVNAGEPIVSISGTKRLSLRADIPERYFSKSASIADARVVSPYSDSSVLLSEVGGKREGEAIASQSGYMPIYFSFDNNGLFVPGSFVKVNLLSGNRTGVISLPLQAISEQQGAYFVYEQLDEECYRKIPVKIGANNGERVEVLSGLSGGERIVSDGVTAVRLAETSAVAPEGHSHNH